MTDADNRLRTLIHQLVPFNDLPVADRMKMLKTAVRSRHVIGENIYSTEMADRLLYLLDGKIDICYQYQQPVLISSDSNEALRPVFAEQESKETYIIVQSNCEFLQFDRQLFNRLIEKEIIIDERELSREISHVENSIYNEILQAVESERLQLPSLPEIALRIKKAIEQADADIEHISKIMELDPALSARLIKVANSPLTRGVSPIHSMRDVIMRLGLKMTRNLVLGFSVAQLFRTRQPVLKKQMKKFYAHSIEIASICYALARHVKDMQPDELLLAGLIHDIGVIPIISYIEKTGLEFSSEQEIIDIIISLRVATGILVVKAWDLPPEMLKVVQHAEHWHYSGAQTPQMEDIVIVAQIYDRLRRKQLSSLPDIHKVPAFGKLFPEKQDPQFAMQILDEAKKEIDEMKSLLGI